MMSKLLLDSLIHLLVLIIKLAGDAYFVSAPACEGTKFKLAVQNGIHDTIGRDLVSLIIHLCFFADMEQLINGVVFVPRLRSVLMALSLLEQNLYFSMIFLQPNTLNLTLQTRYVHLLKLSPFPVKHNWLLVCMQVTQGIKYGCQQSDCHHLEVFLRQNF